MYTKRTRADVFYRTLTGNYTRVTPKLIKIYFFVVIQHALFAGGDRPLPIRIPGNRKCDFPLPHLMAGALIAHH